jgi:transcription elongation factor Elf1
MLMDKEQAKKILRSYMPSYLKMRGLNYSDYFICLNKEHESSKCTMSYNPKDYTIHCYDCGCTYDIFALIGLDYGLLHFSEQFDKAMSLFLPNENITEAKFISANIKDNVTETESLIDYTEYFRECSLKLTQTSFFMDQGFSENLISRFNLGYDPLYKVDSLSIPHVIIPNGPYSFLAINISDEFNYNKSIVGHKHIFNSSAFNYSDNIFITFNELDCLVIEECGSHSVALVDNCNLHELLNIIKQQYIKRDYYICLEKAKTDKNIIDMLSSEFNSLDLCFYIIDIYYPYTSICEMMLYAKDKLRARLTNINKYVSIQPKKLLPKKKHSRYFNIESFKNLDMPNGIYSVISSSLVRRLIISSWLFNESSPMLYCTSNIDWFNLSTIISDYSDKKQINYYSFVQKIGFSEITGNVLFDVNSIVDLVFMQKLKLIKNSTILVNFDCLPNEYIQKFVTNLYQEIKDLNIKVVLFFNDYDKKKFENYSLDYFLVEESNLNSNVNLIDQLKIKHISYDGMESEFLMETICYES